MIKRKHNSMDDVPCNGIYVDSEKIGKYAAGSVVALTLFAVLTGKSDFIERFEKKDFPEGYFSDDEKAWLEDLLKPDTAISLCEWAKSCQ